jgi:hypothetical protein
MVLHRPVELAAVTVQVKSGKIHLSDNATNRSLITPEPALPTNPLCSKTAKA